MGNLKPKQLDLGKNPNFLAKILTKKFNLDPYPNTNFWVFLGMGFECKPKTKKSLKNIDFLKILKIIINQFQYLQIIKEVLLVKNYATPINFRLKIARIK